KPNDHKFIETIPKTGYRFIANVRSIDYQAPAGMQRPASPQAPHQLVGREDASARINALYQQAQNGRGGLICVAGDLGLGKTALVNSVIDDLLNREHTFHLVRVRCSESFTESEPLIPWVEGLGLLAQDAAVNDLVLKFAPNWHHAISHMGSFETRQMK